MTATTRPMTPRAARDAAAALTRGCYQYALIQGHQTWSGAGLRGKARYFSSWYRASRDHLITRIGDAGIPLQIAAGSHNRLTALWGSAVAAYDAAPDADLPAVLDTLHNQPAVYKLADRLTRRMAPVRGARQRLVDWLGARCDLDGDPAALPEYGEHIMRITDAVGRFERSVERMQIPRGGFVLPGARRVITLSQKSLDAHYDALSGRPIAALSDALGIPTDLPLGVYRWLLTRPEERHAVAAVTMRDPARAVALATELCYAHYAGPHQ